jgi:hypothetical protein
LFNSNNFYFGSKNFLFAARYFPLYSFSLVSLCNNFGRFKHFLSPGGLR